MFAENGIKSQRGFPATVPATEFPTAAFVSPCRGGVLKCAPLMRAPCWKFHVIIAGYHKRVELSHRISQSFSYQLNANRYG